MKEEVFAVDEHDRPIEGPLDRSEALAKSLWRRAGGGMVVDRGKGLILCHQRSLDKDERAGYWVATFGGKTRAGEPVADSAKRELLEEFGLEDELSFFCRYRSDERRQYEYVYFAFVDSDASTVNADANEVLEYTWLSIDVVDVQLKSAPNWYVYGYEFDMISRLRE